MSAGQLADVRAKYGRGEAWFYDKYIAPAVMDVYWIVPRFHRMGTPADGERFLDVGCGGGQPAVRFAEVFPQVRVDGVDISPLQIQRARKRIPAGNDRIEFKCASAMELPYPDETFDRVYSMLSVKHWTDVAMGIRECVRVLKPGGWLVVVEADRACTLDDVRSFIGRTRLPAPLKRLWLPFFRTYVAGQSFTAEELKAHFTGLPLWDLRVESLPKTPAFGVIARKGGGGISGGVTRPDMRTQARAASTLKPGVILRAGTILGLRRVAKP